MNRTARRAAVVLLAVGLSLGLAGCSSAVGSSEATTPTEAAASSTTLSPLTPEPAPDVAPDGTAVPTVPTCAPDVQAGVDETVTAQLAALADGDFRAALGYASAAFRSTVTVKAFRAIIRGGYPEVAAARDHAVIDCRQLGPDDAQVLMSVTGESGSVARVAYRLVLEDGGWRIDGASTLSTSAVQAV